MNEKLSTFFSAFKEVYSYKLSFIITVLVSIFVYVFNVLIKNYSFFIDTFSIKIMWLMIIGSVKAMPFSAYLLLSLMSILTGIVVTFAVYLIKRQVKHSAKTGFVGILAGIIAPGCASCALGFVSIIGFGGLLTYLPFNGLEIGYLGIIILIVSIVYLSRKVTGICEIKK